MQGDGGGVGGCNPVVACGNQHLKTRRLTPEEPSGRQALDAPAPTAELQNVATDDRDDAPAGCGVRGISGELGVRGGWATVLQQ